MSRRAVEHISEPKNYRDGRQTALWWHAGASSWNKAAFAAGDYDRRTTLHLAVAEGQTEVRGILLTRVLDAEDSASWFMSSRGPIATMS